MPLYAYYFHREDGAVPVFEVRDAAGEAEAREHAGALLSAHPSCAYVTCYVDDDEVFTLRPNPAAGRPRDLGVLAEAVSSAGLGRAGAAVIATTLLGEIVYWSPRAARLYGWSADEAIGRDILEVTPALQARAQAEAIMARLRAGEAWEGEIVLRDRTGTPFSAYVCDLPVGAIEQGQGMIVGVSVPAKDRRRLEGHGPEMAVRLKLSLAQAEAVPNLG